MGFDGYFDDNPDGLTREAPCRSTLGMFTFALRRLLFRVIQVSFAKFQSLNMCVCEGVYMHTFDESLKYPLSSVSCPAFRQARASQGTKTIGNVLFPHVFPPFCLPFNSVGV